MNGTESILVPDSIFMLRTFDFERERGREREREKPKSLKPQNTVLSNVHRFGIATMLRGAQCENMAFRDELRKCEAQNERKFLLIFFRHFFLQEIIF